MWSINAVTGQQEATFQAVLNGEAGQVLQNSKGTEYRIVPITLPNGKSRSARIYEKNFAKGVTVGQSYLCTATKYADTNGEEQVDIVMSALTNAARATAADLDFLGTEVKEAVEGTVAAGTV